MLLAILASLHNSVCILREVQISHPILKILGMWDNLLFNSGHEASKALG